MLPKLLIKNYKDLDSPKVRNAYGMLSNLLGIFWNTLLCVSKVAVGVIFQSVAVLADGFNNLSDAGSSIISLVGFKMANKPADKDHPFGHARIEYVTALIISFIIVVFGLELVITSVNKITSGTRSEVSIIMMAVLVASILVKWGMFFYYRKVGKKIGSTNLKAAAQDSLNDCISTSLVLLGTVIAYFTGAELDGYFGVAVALFIMFSGIKLIKDTVSPLLGEKPSAELVSSIIKRILAYPGVLGIHDLMVHNYGAKQYFASVHVEVDAEADILESHEMVDMIERDFFAKDGIQLVIHMDPVILNDGRVDALKERTKEAVFAVNPAYKIHDFRVVWGERRKNLIFDVVVPTEEHEDEEVIKSRIFDIMHGEDETLFTVVHIDRNYIGDEFLEENTEPPQKTL